MRPFDFATHVFINLLLYLCNFIYIYIYIYICVSDVESLIHSLKIQTYSFPFIHELFFFICSISSWFHSSAAGRFAMST